MALEQDRGRLTRELKATTREVRHFVYAPGKKPAESVLLLSRRKIPASERTKAKKAASSAKVYWGSCFMEGGALVFECGTAVPETLGKTLRESIKKLTDFVPPKLAARQAAGDVAGVGELTDDDFTIDPEARDHRDRVAKELGEERIQEQPRKPIEGLSDETIDVAKGLEKLGVKPPTFDTPESDDPAVRALADTQKDLQKAKKQIEYVAKLVAYAEEVADLAAFEEAASYMQKVGETLRRISSGVGKAGEAIAKAKKIADWLVAMNELVKATSALEPSDSPEFRRQLEDWVGKIERVWDTSVALQNFSKLVNAAAAGSSAAGVAFFAFAFVGSEIFVAIKLLRQGIENSDTYFTRMNRIIDESERDAAGLPRKRPQRPTPPPEDVTPEQYAAKQEDVRRHNEEVARKRALRELKETFDERDFPLLYIKRRPALAKQILAQVERGNTDAIDWWNEGFLLGTGENRPLPGGGELNAIQKTISAEDARVEIDNLRGTKCAPLESFYDQALKAYVKSKTNR